VDEARLLFSDPRDDNFIKEHVQCILSIGAGEQPNIRAFGTGLKDVFQTMVNIATDTETAHQQFRSSHPAFIAEKRYFRFNVSQGMQDIGLEDRASKPLIVAATERYGNLAETRDLLYDFDSTTRSRSSSTRVEAASMYP
jgi:hypothetical protein